MGFPASVICWASNKLTSRIDVPTVGQRRALQGYFVTVPTASRRHTCEVLWSSCADVGLTSKPSLTRSIQDDAPTSYRRFIAGWQASIQLL